MSRRVEEDLQRRLRTAQHGGWLGEFEGIDLSLRYVLAKQGDARRVLSTITSTHLGMPTSRPNNEHGAGGIHR